MRSRVLRALAAGCWLLASLVAQAAEPKNVLVLYSNNRLVPGNVAVDRGLRDALAGGAGGPIQVFSEFLDRPDFGGEAFDATVTTYLREKYSARPPAAMVAVSDGALDFLLHHRAQLFPGVPLVHAAVAGTLLQAMPALPADVMGTPIDYDFEGTIAQALRWHPQAKRLLVVTGASERDRVWEARLRREIPAIAGATPVEYLAGLPTKAVLQRLRDAGPDAVVFTPGYFQDGEGALFNPREVAVLVGPVSTAPVYGPFDTFIGTGVVGGRMPSFDGAGDLAGQLVLQHLAGAKPEALRVPKTMPAKLQVDWREVRRWGIDEGAIPPDTVVHFREPTFWDKYRNVAIGGLAVILLQSALITALLVERRRRRSAEVAVQKQRSELAHASRLAVAGELTASIAHEINQPLGAVQTSADAADLILQAGGDRRDDLVRIVTRIRRDNLRASEVIRRLRALLARHEPELAPFDVNGVVNDVATLLRPEAQRRQVALDVRPAPAPVEVLGDQTQVQQVLINLLINAMDSIADLPAERRSVLASVEAGSGGVRITVRDHGPGIAAEHLPKLFDSFFSTKQRGMGLGLSIARTIVEAHGGRIWAENAPDGGAIFHVEIPACQPAALAAAAPA